MKRGLYITYILICLIITQIIIIIIITRKKNNLKNNNIGSCIVYKLWNLYYGKLIFYVIGIEVHATKEENQNYDSR